MDTSLGSGLAGGEGIEYFLPEAYFDLKMFDDDGALTVSLGAPRMLPDYAMPVRTKIMPGGIADNDFEIKVGPNSLLQSVVGSSDGKLSDILSGLAKAVALNAGDEAAAVPFFSRTYRFADLSLAESEANAALGAYLKATCPVPVKGKKPTARCEKFDTEVPVVQRAGFVRISAPMQDQGAMIPMERLRQRAQLPQGTPRDAFLYHPMAPVQIGLTLGNGNSWSDIFAVPDKSKISWVRAPGGVLAKQEYNFAFTNGALSSYKRVSKNDAVALVGLPVTIAKSIISAPVELITSRKSVVDANLQYLTQLNLLAKQAQEAQKSCEIVPAICGASVYRIIETSSSKPKSGGVPANPVDPGTGNGGP